MPQKLRQRGKKKKASDKEAAAGGFSAQPIVEDLSHATHQQGDWQQQDYLPLDSGVNGNSNSDANNHTPIEYPQEGPDADVAPFGFVPPELKSYLKDAHANLQRLDAEAAEFAYNQRSNEDEADGEEPVDESSMLRQAMLREMDGQELACATDGECSVILEAIMTDLDERRLRILADRASGSCSTLASHRFGSHVLQAVLRGLQKCLASSAKGKAKQTSSSSSSSESSTGVLRSAQDLICDIAQELIPEAQSLVQATFATHVVRSLLLLLSGQDISIDASTRSKKSAAFRNKAVNPDGPHRKNHTDTQSSRIPRPSSFKKLLKELRSACVPQDSTGQNEARALLMSPSASPTFALLLALESQAGDSTKAGSLADIVLEGMISGSGNTSLESKDGVETLLRHPSGSHALEGILSSSPPEIADRFLAIYAKGKMTRLGSHPVANFVISKTIKRASASTVREALDDVKESGGSKMVKDAKTGLFLAFLERSDQLDDAELQQSAVEIILQSFGFQEDVKSIAASKELACLFFQSVLALKTRNDFEKMVKRRREKAAKANKQIDDDSSSAKKKRKRETDADADADGDANTNATSSLREEEVTVQGSLLLQALVKMPEPHNDLIFKSLTSLSSPLLYTQNPTTSHIYLTSLSSPTSSFLQRRTLILHLLPHLASLADAKYSSRISDLIFSRADGFLKEKILKRILDEGHERFLQSSFYGRFFLRKVGWATWRKDAIAWKSWVKGLSSEPMLPRSGHEQHSIITHDDDDDDNAGAADEVHTKKKSKKPKTKEQAELDHILSGL